MSTTSIPRPIAPSPARPGPAAHGGGASIAIAAIDPIKLMRKHKWLLLSAGATGGVLGVIAHFLMLFLYPIYSVQVIFECITPTTKIGSTEVSVTFEAELEKFMATQVQYMLSDRVINGAVRDPDLRRQAPAWYASYTTSQGFDYDEAADDLKYFLKARIVGDSQLIRLSYWWTKKEDATAVIDTVARTYREYRRQMSEEDSHVRKDALQRMIADMEKTIKARQDERSRLIGEQKIDAMASRETEVNQAIMLMQNELVKARNDEEALKTQFQQLNAERESPAGIKYPDSIRGRIEQYPIVFNMTLALTQLKGELNGMIQRGLGPGHYQRKQLQSRIDGLQASLDALRERMLREAFDSNLDSLASALGSLQAQQADLMAKIADRKKDAVELTKIITAVKDIDDEIRHMQENKTDAADQLNDLKAQDLTPSTMRIREYQSAMVPKEVAFPKLYIMIPGGMLLLLGLVIGAVVLVEVVDQRVKGPADVAIIPRTRVIGMIPHAAEDPANPPRVETVFRDQPGGVLAESFRQVRGAVLKQMQQAGHRSLLVLSGMPGSGSSTIVSNLAQAFAAGDQRVLVVDANFRRPTLNKTLGLPEGPGLAEVLAGSQTLEGAIRKTDNPRLDVLTAGTAEQRRYERLASEAMSQILRETTGKYDIVLLDVAPAVVAGDAMGLAQRCDASLLVVRAMSEKRGMVARLRNELSDMRAEFLGVVVNGVRSSVGGYLRGNILATHKYQNGKD